MFSLFRKKSNPPKSEAELLVEELADVGQTSAYYGDPRMQRIHDKIQACAPELQAQVALEAARWLQTHGRDEIYRNAWWRMHAALANLLDRKLPFDESGLIQLLNWSISERHNAQREVPLMIKLIERFGKTHPIREVLQARVEALAEVVEKGAHDTNDRRRAQRLRMAVGKAVLALPIQTGEAWAEAARAEIEQLDATPQAAWMALLHQCLMAGGSAPNAKWLKQAEAQVARIGAAQFKAALLRWFELADKPMPPVQQGESWTDPDPYFAFQSVHADLLKGLAWASSLATDPEMARALAALAISAYRSAPGLGPRAAKVGNGCIWALGNMPGMEGLAQLSILKLRLRKALPQAMILRALQAAAQRNGLPEDEVAELSVPTYGLEAVGLRVDELGDARSELRVDGSRVAQTWLRADGTRLSAAPKTVQETHGEALQEIKQALKDLRLMLPAQRDRLERLYLEKKKWLFAAWRERYLDHPLVGTISRRLVWKFSQGDRAASGIWWQGQVVGRDGQPLDWLSEATTVELWHPLHVETEVVLAWRQWLVAHEVQQPFKQAHREVYLLSDAERETGIYSNRFAGHLLKQHQFHALCEARGWKDALRLMVDNEVPPPRRLLPQWGLWAEFWVNPSGDAHGTDTNDTGTFLFISTDQVRFYPLTPGGKAAPNASSTSPASRTRVAESVQPLLLEQVPALVFSEMMRDVDLFVGVASVGNDPTWIEGGIQGRSLDYWCGYSFGALSEPAKTRHAVLEALLPRLKIAPRCTLREKFLEVRGDLRTYKIHLGSGNVLLLPEDRYLCIMPSHREMTAADRIYLPFEGDATLALVLSKAFLLAEDAKITDPTIIRQITR